MNLKEEKNALRAEYRRRRSELDRETKERLDAEICRQIISLACFRYADTVLTYFPIKGEIDLNPVAAEALRRGKRLAYPVSMSDGVMVFRYVNDPTSLRQRGKYSIPEPGDDAPLFEGGENTLCIVPAFAFDGDGYRLGYGGGYYDRFLKSFEGTSLGAVYGECLVDALPRGYYDMSVDVIVTEGGSLLTNGKKEKKGRVPTC